MVRDGKTERKNWSFKTKGGRGHLYFIILEGDYDEIENFKEN